MAEPLRRCEKCKRRWPRSHFAKNNRTVYGLSRWCRTCHRLQRYGLTCDEYDAILAQQGGVCPICDGPIKDPAVDHDHLTGRVRGIVCKLCNTGLGALKDSPFVLARAIVYLTRGPGFVPSGRKRQ